MDYKERKPAKLRSTRSIIYIALFVAFIYISGLIKIPAEIPFTLQTMAVMLTASLLGMRRGLSAVLCYIAMGLVGIPVFAGGGGFAYVATKTFGYILAFIPATVFIGTLKNRFSSHPLWLIIVFAAAAMLMLAVGSVYVYFILTNVSAGLSIVQVLSIYALPFVWAEIAKAIAAAIIYRRLCRFVPPN